MSRVFEDSISLALKRKLGRDPRGLDGLAAPDLGVFDDLLASDIARFGLLFGGDALRRQPLLLGYSSGVNGFARGDFGGVDHAIAGDLQRSDFFVARYSFRRDLAVFENTDGLDELA